MKEKRMREPNYMIVWLNCSKLSQYREQAEVVPAASKAYCIRLVRLVASHLTKLRSNFLFSCFSVLNFLKQKKHASLVRSLIVVMVFVHMSALGLWLS